MRKILIVCGLVLFGMGSAQAQDSNIFTHFGANLGVGTEGISVGVAAPCTDYLEVGLGINFMPGFKFGDEVDFDGGSRDVPVTDANGTPTGAFRSYTLSGIDLDAKFARTTLDFKLSAYPFGRNADWFVTAGFSFGGKKIAKLTGYSDEVAKIYEENPFYTEVIDVELDKYDIAVDRKGNVKGDIRVNGFRPYLGLGWGRLVPKNHRVGFRVEAGCQFMGKMKIYQNGKELKADELKDNDNDLSKMIDKFKVYPVLKFTLTTRIL